jgi:hypothetical protein
MTPTDAAAISACLSVPRMSTYLAACRPDPSEDVTVAALRLYRWNVELSAALMVPIHLCEITVRNAASDAIEAVYGARWPWSPGLRQALTNPLHGYRPRQDLIETASAHSTAGKVIAELKFAFWESIFTSRHDTRLWGTHLRRVFPNADQTISVEQVRGDVRARLGYIRILRNRIAHHEPIFDRPIADHLARMRTLVEHRSTTMLTWLDQIETVTALLATKPPTNP